MRLRTLSRHLPAVLFLTAGCARAAGSPDPGTGAGTVFFSGFATGNYDLFSVRADGYRLRRLTADPEFEQHPAVSPDGQRVAYLRQRTGSARYDLWIMNADGTDKRRRVAAEGDVLTIYAPAWSPDGRRLLYSYQETGSPRRRLATVHAVLGDPVVLGAEGWNATWSPNGRYLAYVRDVAGLPQLVTSRPDGSDLVLRADLPGCCGMPQWSPDGTRIHFQTTAGGNTTTHIVYLAGGTPARQAAPGAQGSVAWSADGMRFAFADAFGDLWVAPAHGPAERIVAGAVALAGIAWGR